MAVRISLKVKIFLAAAVIFTAGCLGMDKEFGQAIEQTSVTKISGIMGSPSSYQGKTVRLEAKIISECPTGCWFNLNDSTGMIYVDLNPSGFAIPQKVGSSVIVEGTVKIRDGIPYIVGKGVVIR